MTVFFHELKRNRIALIVWTAAISFMLGICVLIYPEMSSQMGEISEMFADMGSFSAAFGMDQINFGEFKGYFRVECGNVLGLGGAFFAAIIGISALAKEERDRTAEYLLTHPISRKRIITEKYLSVMAQILILNIVVVLVTVATIFMIGEKADFRNIALLVLAYLILQIEIASITFGISAFLKRGGLAIGLGFAIMSYFLNIVSNLTDDAKFIKYITPFGYTDGSHILTNNSIEVKYLITGLIFTVLGIVIAYYKYTKKDIT